MSKDKKTAMIVAGLWWFLLLVIETAFAVNLFTRPERSGVEFGFFVLYTLFTGFFIGVSYTLLQRPKQQ